MKRGCCRCPVIKVSADDQTHQSFSDLAVRVSQVAIEANCDSSKKFISLKKQILSWFGRPSVVGSGQLATHSINHSHTPSLFAAAVNMLFTNRSFIYHTCTSWPHILVCIFTGSVSRGFRCNNNKRPCYLRCRALKSLGGVVGGWVVSLLGPMLPAH